MSGSPACAGEMQERDQNGRFKSGKSGNPRGKKPGTLNRATQIVQELLNNEAGALARKCVELALEGDPAALRLCLERLIPPRKDSPIILAGLPKIESVADLPKATGKLLHAVGLGIISPKEAVILAGLVEAHGRTLVLAAESTDAEDLTANAVPTPHEMERIMSARMAEIEKERTDFLPARQEEVRDLKEAMGKVNQSFGGQETSTQEKENA